MARRAPAPQPPDPRLVDGRNRIAIPAGVMRRLGLRPGDFIEFEVDADGNVRVHKLCIHREPARDPDPP